MANLAHILGLPGCRVPEGSQALTALQKGAYGNPALAWLRAVTLQAGDCVPIVAVAGEWGQCSNDCGSGVWSSLSVFSLQAVTQIMGR